MLTPDAVDPRESIYASKLLASRQCVDAPYEAVLVVGPREAKQREQRGVSVTVSDE
jgi:hypothetical protein